MYKDKKTESMSSHVPSAGVLPRQWWKLVMDILNVGDGPENRLFQLEQSALQVPLLPSAPQVLPPGRGGNKDWGQKASYRNQRSLASNMVIADVQMFSHASVFLCRCFLMRRGHPQAKKVRKYHVRMIFVFPDFYKASATLKTYLPLSLTMYRRLKSYQGLGLNIRHRRSSQHCRDGRNRLTCSHLTREEDRIATQWCSKKIRQVFVVAEYLMQMYLQSACSIINKHSSHTLNKRTMKPQCWTTVSNLSQVLCNGKQPCHVLCGIIASRRPRPLAWASAVGAGQGNAAGATFDIWAPSTWPPKKNKRSC